MKPLSRSKFMRVEARSLRVHPLAQRRLVPSKLKKLMADLDLDAIGVLHCVEYEIDGVLAIWIIDGQHRWRALMDHGFGEWLVEVKIHTEVTDNARASELFLKLNDRAVVSPFDRFQNEVGAHMPAAVGATRILQARDLRAGAAPSGQVGNLLAIAPVAPPVATKVLRRINDHGQA